MKSECLLLVFKKGEELLLLWLHSNSSSYFVSSRCAHQGLQIVFLKSSRSSIENAFLAELLKMDEADFIPEINPTPSLSLSLFLSMSLSLPLSMHTLHRLPRR